MEGVSEDQCFIKLYSFRKYMTEQVVKNELLTFRRISHLWPYLWSLCRPTSFSCKVNITFLSTTMFTSTYLTRRKNSLKPLKVVIRGQDWWTFRCRQLFIHLVCEGISSLLTIIAFKLHCAFLYYITVNIILARSVFSPIYWTLFDHLTVSQYYFIKPYLRFNFRLPWTNDLVRSNNVRDKRYW